MSAPVHRRHVTYARRLIETSYLTVPLALKVCHFNVLLQSNRPSCHDVSHRTARLDLSTSRIAAFAAVGRELRQRARLKTPRWCSAGPAHGSSA